MYTLVVQYKPWIEGERKKDYVPECARLRLGNWQRRKGSDCCVGQWVAL